MRAVPIVMSTTNYYMRIKGIANGTVSKTIFQTFCLWWRNIQNCWNGLTLQPSKAVQCKYLNVSGKLSAMLKVLHKSTHSHASVYSQPFIFFKLPRFLMTARELKPVLSIELGALVLPLHYSDPQLSHFNHQMSLWSDDLWQTCQIFILKSVFFTWKSV